MSLKKILIIDDDQDILNYFLELLSQQHYEIKVASSADEAFTVLQDFIPDLILLDIKMPDMDGWQLNRKIKSDTKISNIPVAFLTAKEDLSDKLTALKEGVIDYIMKPINSKEIIERINSILERCYGNS